MTSKPFHLSTLFLTVLALTACGATNAVPPAAMAQTSATLTTQGLALSVPTGLAASAITETSLNLSWTPATAHSGTVSYEVSEWLVCGRVLPGCFPRLLPTPIIKTSATTAAISGLTAGSTHTYGVTAVSSTGSRSVVSALLTVSTLRPLGPTNVVVTSTTQTTVGLSWTASVGPVPVTGYRIYDLNLSGVFAPSLGFSAFEKLSIDHVTGTSATVSGLLPGTRHLLTVVALNAASNESPRTIDSQVVATTVSVPTLP